MEILLLETRKDSGCIVALFLKERDAFATWRIGCMVSEPNRSGRDVNIIIGGRLFGRRHQKVSIRALLSFVSLHQRLRMHRIQ